MASYKLDPAHPGIARLSRFFRIFGLLSIALVIPTLLLGDTSGAIIWLLFPMMIAVVLPWFLGRNAHGEVVLSDDALRMVTKGRTLIYPWAHVEGVREFAPADEGGQSGLMYRLLGFPKYPGRAVEVRLDRSIRDSPLRARSGTSVIGLPSGQKKHIFFVEDPDALYSGISEMIEKKRAA